MRTAAVRTLAALTAAAAVGCTGNDLPAVTVTPVPTAGGAACDRFAAALPGDLGDDLPRRDTVPDDPRVAAYGDPPVVIRCGVPPTEAYRTGDQLFDISGVDWFPQDRGDAVVWSLPRAFVNVEVTIPKKWSGDRLARLAEAVRAMR